jgi:hypothetical protein
MRKAWLGGQRALMLSPGGVGADVLEVAALVGGHLDSASPAQTG